MSQTDDQYLHSYLNDPDAELFDAGTVDRFFQDAEDEFAAEYPCIHTRVALSVTSGTATYELSDNVISIRRVTWKGKKLEPLPARQHREIFQNAAQQGTPAWYVYNNIGLNKLKFFPIPNETISSTTNDLFGAEISSRVIIDYFRTPDYSTFVIPSYIRRRLLKTYTMKSCFRIEGTGQNMKNAQYFNDKWLALKERYKLLLGELHNKPRKLVLGSMSGDGYFPGRPILPMNYLGTSCSAGE
jgi:hypothetical protein